jgi:hypothetical protein
MTNRKRMSGPIPDVLLLANGKRVTDARTWTEQRRPEIIKLYETEIYGKVPASAPKVKWTVTKTETSGWTITKEIVGQIGDGLPLLSPAPCGGGRVDGIAPPAIRISFTLPANAQAFLIADRALEELTPARSNAIPPTWQHCRPA